MLKISSFFSVGDRALTNYRPVIIFDYRIFLFDFTVENFYDYGNLE